MVFGVLMAATAVLMIKASTLPPALLASARLLGATVVLLPFWWNEFRKRSPRAFWASVRPSLLPGLFLGLHFISWNTGARATLAGNATLVVNTVPLVMPFLAWTFLRESPTKREITGTAIAFLGMIVLAWGDYHFSPEHLVGDGLCFLSMLAYALYMLLARKRATSGTLLTYLTPLYASAGVVCLAWALVLEQPFHPVGGVDLLLIAGLVFGPTLLGHSIANWSMTVLRAQTVSLVNLTQFAFAGLLAFFLFGEVPGPVFVATAVLVVMGAGVALFPFRSRGKKAAAG
jgi:drug/metabolite transporter (DMT)-like permease